MKRTLIIIALVSVVLLCGLVYAEKQIIVASGDETCKHECDVKNNICEMGCSYKKGYNATWCTKNCMESYDRCMDRCYR